MHTVSKMVENFNRRIFRKVTNNRLVYNACWEDPEIDRQLLELDQNSSVLMITSGGCNALDYLLDAPASIHCVDINPAQNALLSLKKALFKLGDYDLLWKLFGQGTYANIKPVYHTNIRPLLSEKFRPFWATHIDYFSSPSSSFYYQGTAGAVAKLIVGYLYRRGLKKDIKRLLHSHSLAEQRYYFDEIKPHLSTKFSRWLLNSNTVLSCLGIPENQRNLIDDGSDAGMHNFVLNAIEDVFTARPVTDNYFWRVYLTGSYTKDCCPNYLKKTNFKTIQQRMSRIDITNGCVRNCLKQSTSKYSHFVLLDHQDWLTNSSHSKLQDEWKLILTHAQPGARVLLRSAARARSFIPDFVYNHVSFRDRKTKQLHAKDRVGTYGSTHLAVVNSPL